ncbi:MAG: hypothetical protein LIO43_01495 [Clostridiales bacterium]|nr:hypothetical protein [Clostridiales bacterium]
MNVENEKKRTAIALGDFDGMHLAHKTVVTGAENSIIYCVNNKFSLLQKSLFQKRYPNAVFADFDEIKNLSGREFIENIIIKKFNAGMVLCGFNFRFGKDASWSALDMRKYLEEKDIWVRILEAQDYESMPISSTRIRKAVKEGRINAANEMLGYNFTYESEVLHGDRRGRTIGNPTINQHLPKGLTVPYFGVYESRVLINNISYKAFTNIGLRPTWHVNEPLSETHIFNFNGDLYGQTVTVELVNYLRKEKVFKDVNELKEQLNYDKSSII